MNKVIILLSLILSLYIKNADCNVKGFYINSKGDTIYCTFAFGKDFVASDLYYLDNRFEISILDANNRELNLKPDTIKAFVVSDICDRKFVSLKNNFKLRQIDFAKKRPYVYLEIFIEDYLKVYGWYYWTRFDNSGIDSTGYDNNQRFIRYYLQKGEGEVIQVESTNSKFKDQMKDFFACNPELVYRIENNEFKFKNILWLIAEYNNWKMNGSVIKNDTSLYQSLDIPPSFEGKKINDLNFYYKDKIDWPEDASIKDKVIIQGIVEKDGTITNLKVSGIKSHPELNQKFLEVAQTMKGWKPGKYHGLDVRSVVTFSIKY
jgi:hypothetical protein